MARQVGLPKDAVQRLWAANDLQPHRTRLFKLSNDPQFEAKFWEVVGLSLDPPTQAVGLCCDEKSQCQALWSAPNRAGRWGPDKSGRARMIATGTGR
jgi:hypothetical protein